ncbi:condensation domain-containing protein [Paenibacillus sp. 481]|uniref:condensation domain-containing protein n=1 Tax=Paenibacillus sp. 481 TaxID=2835869 RepID=UPI001E3D09BD|nr:condensation domain-containing protein [Paenibacillus sp. 481]UHA72437.1 hypothetical protein KIK04_17410 [Paenibacillus sp. 481]
MSDSTVFPLTQAQQRIWYTELLYPNTTTNVLSGTIMMRGHMKLDALQQAMRFILQQNDAFRIKITEVDGDPKQVVQSLVKIEIEWLDFSEGDPERQAREWLDAHNRTSIPLFDSKLSHAHTSCRYHYWRLNSSTKNCIWALTSAASL